MPGFGGEPKVDVAKLALDERYITHEQRMLRVLVHQTELLERLVNAVEKKAQPAPQPKGKR